MEGEGIKRFCFFLTFLRKFDIEYKIFRREVSSLMGFPWHEGGNSLGFTRVPVKKFRIKTRKRREME